MTAMRILQQIKQARIIISTAWQRSLTYRFTVVMYRIGEMTEVVVLILMWSAIYASGGGTIQGFTLNEMITYVLIGNLCAVAVRNFLPGFIATDINNGKLSMFLVKPISYVRFIFLHELGRVSLATVVSLVSQALIIIFFFDKIVINMDPRYLVLIVTMVFCAFVIELLLGFLIGTIAFWTEDVDGIYVTLDRVKRFFAGGYFPLTLLPAALATVSTYLPFQYSFFAPASLYLKKMDLHQGLQGVMIQVIWIVLLSCILYIVWKRGLRRYEATGS